MRRNVRVSGWKGVRPVRIFDDKVEIVITLSGDEKGIDGEDAKLERLMTPSYLIETGEGGHRWLRLDFPGGQPPASVYEWLTAMLRAQTVPVSG